MFLLIAPLLVAGLACVPAIAQDRPEVPPAMGTDAVVYLATSDTGEMRAYVYQSGQVREVVVPAGVETAGFADEYCISIVFKRGTSVPDWIPLIGGEHRFQISGYVCGAYDCDLSVRGGIEAIVELGKRAKGWGGAQLGAVWSANRDTCEYEFDYAFTDVWIAVEAKIPGLIIEIPAIIQLEIGAQIGGTVVGSLEWIDSEFPSFPDSGRISVTPELGLYGKVKFLGGLVRGSLSGTGSITATIGPGGFSVDRACLRVRASARVFWVRYSWDSGNRWCVNFNRQLQQWSPMSVADQGEMIVTIEVPAGTGAVYGGSPLLANVVTDLHYDGPPVLTTRDGVVLAAWTQDADACDGHVGATLVVAEYSGDTWSAPVEISPNTNFNRDPALVFDAGGNAMLVWSSAPADEVKVRRSAGASPCDGKGGVPAVVEVLSSTTEFLTAVEASDIYFATRHGGAWSAPALVASPEGRDDEVCAAADATGRVLAAWSHLEDGTQVVKAAVYESGNWSEARTISGGGAETPACVFIEGRPVVVWVQDTDGDPATVNDKDLYSSVLGSAWSSPAAVFSATGSDTSPTLCADGAAAHLVWQREDGLWHAWGDAGGWTTIGRVTGPNSSDPVLAADSEGCVLTWQSDYDNDSRVMLATCRVRHEQPYDKSGDGKVDAEDLTLMLDQSPRVSGADVLSLSRQWQRTGSIPVAYWSAAIVAATDGEAGCILPAVAPTADGRLAVACLKRDWGIEDDTDVYYEVVNRPPVSFARASAQEEVPVALLDPREAVLRRVAEDFADGMITIAEVRPGALAARPSGQAALAFPLPEPPDRCCGPTYTPTLSPTPTITPTPKSDYYILLPGDVRLDFVFCPAGTFQMGSDAWWSTTEETPVHPVTFAEGFYMQLAEVTIEQYAAFLRDTGDESGLLWDEEICPLARSNGDYVLSGSSHGHSWSQPIVGVSWQGAVAFADWVTQAVHGTYSLPSEAQWEYACRAGTTTRFSYGDDEFQLRDYAIYWESSGYSGHAFPVMSKLPNPWGLFDMHGNVEEWCLDWANYDYTGAPTDGSAWLAGQENLRIFRGGSYMSYPFSCQSSKRAWTEPISMSTEIGFRIVRAQQPAPPTPTATFTATPTSTPTSTQTPRAPDWSITLPGGIKMGFMQCPAGPFQMGCEDDTWAWGNETPVHSVTVAHTFYMQATEVTQAQWQALMGSNPADDYTGLGEQYPVYNVSWIDCQTFVDRLNAHIADTGQGLAAYRLPSEAEWEYACRGGTTTHFSFGDSDCEPSGGCAACELSDHAWWCANNGAFQTPEYGVKPVAQKRPNPWGLYDMHGNVSEWCLDAWHDDYTGAPTDGSAWDGGPGFFNVFRGGSFSSNAQACRSSHRSFEHPDLPSSSTGLRLARFIREVDTPTPTATPTPPVTPHDRLTVILPGGAEMDFIHCPAGSFQMGSDDDADWSPCYPCEQPAHTVSFAKSFYMQETEVTLAQYAAFLRDTGHELGVNWDSPDCPLIRIGGDYLLSGNPSGQDWTQPMVYVNWCGAMVLAGWLSHATGGAFSLPSEAQWEYAARAGTATRFSFGDSTCAPGGCTPCDLDAFAVWCGSDPGANAVVRSKSPNPWGLFDMHGNVAEWCRDPLYDNYDGAPVDGSVWYGGDNDFRIVRGGSRESEAHACRSSSRGWSFPASMVPATGFRLVLSDVPPPATPTPTPELPQSLTLNLPDGVTMDLVRCPAGSFQMGGSDDWAGDVEKPVHPVTFAEPFYMQTSEVTQAQWQAIMGTNPAAGVGVGPDYPVYYVSWSDCQTFAANLNAHIVSTGQGPLVVRLPSEAEWEYACRAGSMTRYFFGDSAECGIICGDCAAGTLPGSRTDYMWYCGNNDPNGTKPAGGKLPNQWGLYDMHGNVYEWCQDLWHDDFTGAPEDGSAWEVSAHSDRVVRSSHWESWAGNCRAANRSHNDPTRGWDFCGLRLAASADVSGSAGAEPDR